MPCHINVLLPSQINQLAVRRELTGAAVGNRATVYVLTNKSAATCTLYGYPGFVLLAANGQPVRGVKVTRSLNTYLHTGQLRQAILAPKAMASFAIGYAGGPVEGETCPKVAKVKITPPNAYQYLLAEPIAPCGKVEITPVEASIIHT